MVRGRGKEGSGTEEEKKKKKKRTENNNTGVVDLGLDEGGVL